MDYQSDDDIELLKTSNGDESRPPPVVDDFDSTVNPLQLLNRTNSTEESIPVASVRALQISFSSLQHQLNEKTKRFNEIVHENNVLKRRVKEYEKKMNNQDRIRPSVLMDDFVIEPSALAAGGTSEDDTIAEQRASDGLIRHLQKEVLIRDNALSQTRDELYRLRYNNEELQKDIGRYLIENENLKKDRDVLEDSLNKVKQDCDEKVKQIRHLNDSLKNEIEATEKFKQETKELKLELQHLERTIPVNRDGEVNELKSRLAQYESENKRLYAKINSMENEKQALTVQCRQLQIAETINSQNHQSLRQQEEADDVDGDITFLKNALGFISQQRKDYEELKDKMKQQQHVIRTLTSRGVTKMTDLRPEAQGSSFAGRFEEIPHPEQSHVYMNTSIFSNMQQDSAVPVQIPLHRRASDRSDYRPAHLSPRIDDALKPTGTQNIAQMVAQVSVTGVRRESANAAVSPRSNQDLDVSENRYINSPLSSPRIKHPAVSTHYVNTTNTQQKSPSPVRQSAFVSPSVVHPVNTADVGAGQIRHAAQFASSDVQAADARSPYNGARPRTYASSTSALALEHSDMVSSSNTKNNLPMRMTKSEIYFREKSPTGNLHMTRSNLEPVRPLEIPIQNRNTSDSLTRVSEENYRHAPCVTVTKAQSGNESDYENVYNNRVQTEVKRPLEEHEDNTFVVAPECSRPNMAHNMVLDQSERSNNVSALKICPVCNLECSRLTMEQFQMHVVECFDNNDEAPVTLLPSGTGDDDRVCPMCSESFPLTIPQETYEQHVLAHFGDDPSMDRDRFEIVP